MASLHITIAEIQANPLAPSPLYPQSSSKDLVVRFSLAHEQVLVGSGAVTQFDGMGQSSRQILVCTKQDDTIIFSSSDILKFIYSEDSDNKLLIDITTDENKSLGKGSYTLNKSSDTNDFYSVIFIDSVGKEYCPILSLRILFQIDSGYDDKPSRFHRSEGTVSLSDHRPYSSSFFYIMQRRMYLAYCLFTLLLVLYPLGLIPSTFPLAPQSAIIDGYKLPIGKLTFQVGMDLRGDHFVEACVGLFQRSCEPVHLFMHSSGNLVLYRGVGPRTEREREKYSKNGNDASLTNNIIWQSGRHSAPMFGDVRALVTATGLLEMWKGGKKVWDSELSGANSLSKYISFE